MTAPDIVARIEFLSKEIQNLETTLFTLQRLSKLKPDLDLDSLNINFTCRSVCLVLEQTKLDKSLAEVLLQKIQKNRLSQSKT